MLDFRKKKLFFFCSGTTQCSQSLQRSQILSTYILILSPVNGYPFIYVYPKVAAQIFRIRELKQKQELNGGGVRTKVAFKDKIKVQLFLIVPCG